MWYIMRPTISEVTNAEAGRLAGRHRFDWVHYSQRSVWNHREVPGIRGNQSHDSLGSMPASFGSRAIQPLSQAPGL